MKFSLHSFSGIRPATDPRLVPGDTAQVAHNCILKSGKVIPLKENVREQTCADSTRTVFRQNGEWVELDFDADCVTTPVNEDQYDRIYFSGHPDGYLRMRGKFSGETYSVRRVFIPKPASPPEVKTESGFQMDDFSTMKITFQPSGLAGANKQIVTCRDRKEVEEGHWQLFFSVGDACLDVLVVRPFDDGSGVLTLGSDTITLNAGSGTLEIKKKDGSAYATLRFSMESFIPHQPSCPDGTKTKIGGFDLALNVYIEYNSSAQYRSYCYTLVDDLGQEGPPSDVSEIVQSYDGDTVIVTMRPMSATVQTASVLSAARATVVPGLDQWLTPVTVPSYERPDDSVSNPDFDGSFTKIRLYRTAGTETDADFFFVAEFDYANTVEYTDTKPNSELAERLIRCENPPLNMNGLVKCSNGSLAAFRGKDLYFCEPYQPNNWPVSYNYVTANSIVGLAVSGSSVFALTEGEPEIFSGSHPESMGQYRSAIRQACVSKKSICSAESTVFYASPDGLIALSSDTAAKIATENHFRKEQWRKLRPAEMLAASHDNKVYLFSGKICVILDFSGGGLEITTADADSASLSIPDGDLDDGADWCGDSPKVVFTVEDLLNDTLYLLHSGALWSFGTGTQFRIAAYRSKIIELPYAKSFSVSRVTMKAYGADSLFRLFSLNGNFETALKSDTGFRIPVMRREKEWFAELRGRDVIRSLELADTVAELKRDE